MSGKKKGGTPKLVIKKKGSPQYPPDPAAPGQKKIQQWSQVDARTIKPSKPTRMKLGIRIKQAQQAETFEIRYGPRPGDIIPLTPQPPNDPIAQDLTTTLGAAAEEKWVTYLADYGPKHGTKFDTTRVLKPFGVHPNGFQAVTVALCHESQTFANGVYIFGTSLLPGENNAGWQMALGPSQKPAGGATPTPPASRAKLSAKGKKRKK
jgi:hypothetical protein